MSAHNMAKTTDHIDLLIQGFQEISVEHVAPEQSGGRAGDGGRPGERFQNNYNPTPPRPDSSFTFVDISSSPADPADPDMYNQSQEATSNICPKSGEALREDSSELENGLAEEPLISVGSEDPPPLVGEGEEGELVSKEDSGVDLTENMETNTDILDTSSISEHSIHSEPTGREQSRLRYIKRRQKRMRKEQKKRASAQRNLHKTSLELDRQPPRQKANMRRGTLEYANATNRMLIIRIRKEMTSRNLVTTFETIVPSLPPRKVPRTGQTVYVDAVLDTVREVRGELVAGPTPTYGRVKVTPAKIPLHRRF